ncbi:MAG: hypothetical protein Q7V19_04520, partial [Bacteroidales bacterium]|nr:hypothetical protein [Bacteroidales bacterium]
MGVIRIILYPILGFAFLIALWWLVAKYITNLMPMPLEALKANIDFILHPFYVRGPGDVGIGLLLLESL